MGVFLVAAVVVFFLVAGGVFANQSGVFAFVGKKTIAIPDAVAGENVTLKGVVEVLDTVEAPFSKRLCAAFELKVDREKVTGFGKNQRRSWVPVVHDIDSRDFVVVDEAGNRAFVDASLLRMYFKADKKGHSGGIFSDKELIAFLNARGISTKTSLGHKPFRVREAVLEAGERVTVHGRATWEADPNASMETVGYRSAEIPKRLRITGIDGSAVIVRDR